MRFTELGQAVRARRRTAGMTRADLANRSGLSANTVMKVEQGQTRDPGVFKVAALCRALSVSIDGLVTEAERNELAGEEPTMVNGIVSVGYEGRQIDDFVAGHSLAAFEELTEVVARA